MKISNRTELKSQTASLNETNKTDRIATPAQLSVDSSEFLQSMMSFIMVGLHAGAKTMQWATAG